MIATNEIVVPSKEHLENLHRVMRYRERSETCSSCRHSAFDATECHVLRHYRLRTQAVATCALYEKREALYEKREATFPVAAIDEPPVPAAELKNTSSTSDWQVNTPTTIGRYFWRINCDVEPQLVTVWEFDSGCLMCLSENTGKSVPLNTVLGEWRKAEENASTVIRNTDDLKLMAPPQEPPPTDPNGWREDFPTEAGSYYWRADSSRQASLVLVYVNDDGNLACRAPDSGNVMLVYQVGGEWARSNSQQFYMKAIRTWYRAPAGPGRYYTRLNRRSSSTLMLVENVNGELVFTSPSRSYKPVPVSTFRGEWSPEII